MAKHSWKKCSKSLPEVDEQVVICTKRAGEFRFVVARRDKAGNWLDRFSKQISEPVICWFSIPEIDRRPDRRRES